jgi:pimeloyl-ACP methyl ester carboxylesterase
MLPPIDAFVADLVRSFGEPVVLAGNSLGGVASLRAACDGDLPLAAIAPISPAGFGHQPWVDIVERFGALTAIARTPLPVPVGALRRAAALLYLRLGCRSRVDGDAGRRYASHYRTAADVRRHVTRVRPLLREIGDPACYALERVRVPVLAIWGRHDRFTPFAGSRRLLAACPDARLVELHGCGHCPQLEVPERIAALLDQLPG